MWFGQSKLRAAAAQLLLFLLLYTVALGRQLSNSAWPLKLVPRSPCPQVALHHVFNTPEDKIVWDVGHQAYIHKMLTGRRARMGTIRQQGGLSGGWLGGAGGHAGGWAPHHLKREKRSGIRLACLAVGSGGRASAAPAILLGPGCVLLHQHFLDPPAPHPLPQASPSARSLRTTPLARGTRPPPSPRRWAWRWGATSRGARTTASRYAGCTLHAGLGWAALRGSGRGLHGAAPRMGG